MPPPPCQLQASIRARALSFLAVRGSVLPCPALPLKPERYLLFVCTVSPHGARGADGLRSWLQPVLDTQDSGRGPSAKVEPRQRKQFLAVSPGWSQSSTCGGKDVQLHFQWAHVPNARSRIDRSSGEHGMDSWEGSARPLPDHLVSRPDRKSVV